MAFLLIWIDTAAAQAFHNRPSPCCRRMHVQRPIRRRTPAGSAAAGLQRPKPFDFGHPQRGRPDGADPGVAAARTAGHCAGPQTVLTLSPGSGHWRHRRNRSGLVERACVQPGRHGHVCAGRTSAAAESVAGATPTLHRHTGSHPLPRAAGDRGGRWSGHGLDHDGRAQHHPAAGTGQAGVRTPGRVPRGTGEHPAIGRRGGLPFGAR